MSTAPVGLVVGGRYRCSELLKSGHGVNTWLGADEAAGAQVVVKTVDATAVSSAVRLRVAHEALILRRLETDGIRALEAVGRQGDLLYLVQPFVPGVTLRERLAGRGPLSVDSSLRVGIDVLEALQHAHDGAVLHRDVKPANVIVDADEPVTRAHLIDFGFARSAWLDPVIRDEPVGTVRYLAPEASGALRGGGVDERSDLYAVGVLLFECLAGRPPFEGRDVGEVLRQHLSAPAAPLRGIRADVPRALDAAVQRLLRKDPDERYQSAGAVLADLRAIAVARGRGVVDPAVVIGLHDRRQALTDPAFVGRAAELGVLSGLLERAGRGRGGLALVEGESGGGKTRLLDELANRAGPGILVLAGEGLDQAGQWPFQVFQGVADGIARQVGDDPGLGDRLRQRIGDRAGAVVDALPALAPVLLPGPTAGPDEPAGAPAPPAREGPEAFGEIRSLEALTALLDALGDPAQPALVMLDDCQWADRLSLGLLAWWAERPPPSGRHVLVVGTYRSEDVRAGSPLRTMERAARLELAPFTSADVRTQLESMAGPLPPRVVDVVAELSEGSPFMSAAVLRGLVEAEALVDTPEGWVVEPDRLATAQTSRRAALFLVRRLEQLSPPSLALLSVGAVLGKEFDLGLAVELAGHGPERAAVALSDAVRRRILWVDEPSGRCAFRHDRLREALLDRLSEADRRVLHVRAALRLEVTGTDRPFDIAYHFDAGGRADRALPYALRAADEARARHALDVAVNHYRIAERAAATDGTTRARVAEGLGDVLTLQGDYSEAAAYLEQARALTKGARRAAIEGKLGDVAFKRGDHATARSYLEGALRQLGRRVPSRPSGFLLLLVKELVVQAAHTLAPRLLVGRRQLEGAEEEFLAIRVLSRLAYVYWFHAGRIACAWAHLREMNLAERYPPTPELAQAYSEHAPVMTMVPWYRRGIAYAERSLALRREQGDLWGQGQSLHFYGVVLYAASRFGECIARCEEAVRLLDRTGDRWEVNTATWHIAFAHYRLGELARAVEVAQAVHAAAGSIGDATARAISLSAWARASAGQVPADLTAAALASSDDPATAAEVRLAEGVRLLAEGAVEAAVAVLDEAAGIARRSGMHQEYAASVLPWLATALRVRAETAPPFRTLGHCAQLRRAAEVARRARVESRDYRNNRPHALREQALVAALRGRARRARRLLAASLAEAERQEARHEHALTRQAAGRVGLSFGWKRAGEVLAEAEADLRAMLPATRADAAAADQVQARDLSLADRFEALQDAARRIAAAPSADAVYAAVVEASLTLLRGETCQVVSVPPAMASAEPPDPAGTGDQLSQTLVRRAVKARVPVVSGRERAEQSDSVVLAGLRSLLCAPIVCEDEVVACFSVSHRQLGDLFSPDEVALAEFIATLAGAALEHVAGTEARLRTLAQNSSDVITIVDRNGIITYQSSSVARVFGSGPAERTGRPFGDWVHPDDAPAVLQAIANAVAGATDRQVLECRLRHGDGSWRHVETALNDLFGDPSVRGLVLNSRDVTERRELEDELRERALHDDLTGLANRGLFADRIEHCLSRRPGRSAALLFIDLDDFKGINDTFGHPAGDRLLRSVARRLLTCVRPHDTVARIGGDEFAILLEDADVAKARKVAERVMAAMAPSFEVAGEDLGVRISVGVAVGRTGEGGPGAGDELLNQADAAMYAAKARGKSRFEIFEPSMRVAALDRVMVRSELQWAVHGERLELHYQPLMSLGDGQMVGVEAVLRWRHPTRGLLLPSEFIAVAEESGLIVPIGAWALRRACVEVRRLRGARPGGTPLGVSVNVSARQLRDGGLAREVEAALAEGGLDARLLTLELTETATLAEGEPVLAELRGLKALGVRLAIDDFGTGFSSMAHLRRFPVDQIKIDRSFVSGLGDSPADDAIVASMIGLAHSLGLEVVGEGVETAGQVERLTRLGCDLAQGFRWKAPSPAGEVAAWVARALHPHPAETHGSVAPPAA